VRVLKKKEIISFNLYIIIDSVYYIYNDTWRPTDKSQNVFVYFTAYTAITRNNNRRIGLSGRTLFDKKEKTRPIA